MYKCPGPSFCLWVDIPVFLAVPRMSLQPSWAILDDVSITQTALYLEKLWFLLSLCHKHITRVHSPPTAAPPAHRGLCYTEYLTSRERSLIEFQWSIISAGLDSVLVTFLKCLLKSSYIQLCLSFLEALHVVSLMRLRKKQLHLYWQSFFKDITKSPVLSLWDDSSWINKKAGFWSPFAKEEKNVLYYVA